MRKKVLSLLLALVLLTGFYTVNVQAADPVTMRGVIVSYTTNEYSLVNGDVMSPQPSYVSAIFESLSIYPIGYYTENNGNTSYSLTLLSCSGNIYKHYITYKCRATTPNGSYAVGTLVVGYFV